MVRITLHLFISRETAMNGKDPTARSLGDLLYMCIYIYTCIQNIYTCIYNIYMYIIYIQYIYIYIDMVMNKSWDDPPSMVDFS